MPTTILKTSNGILDAADQQLLQDLVGRLTPGSEVALHLHGGLVDEKSGLGIANRLKGAAATGGFGYPDAREQIYVVWRTGAFETLKANWTDLFDNDRLYKTLLNKLLDFAAARLKIPGGLAGGRSAYSAMSLTPTEIAARLEARPEGDPFADVDLVLETAPGGRGASVPAEPEAFQAEEFMMILRQDMAFNQIADDIAAAVNVDDTGARSMSARGDLAAGRSMLARLDDNLQRQLTATVPPGAGERALFSGFNIGVTLLKKAGLVALRIIRRFRTRRDHGFYATVVEELIREFYGDLIGAAIWGMMTRDAGDHFDKANGLGKALAEAFAANPPAKLFVSAHSAGSIWASHMLKAMGGMPNAPKIKLAFLAPAVRIDLFAEALTKGGHLISSLRMFTMRDELERADPVLGKKFGFLYPSSLLYLVSGAFEDEGAEAFPDAPILGMHRFRTTDSAWLQDPKQVAANNKVAAFFSMPNNGIVLSTINGGPGLSSQAISHGTFDQDADTLASVAHYY